jgi:aspartate racemase
MHPEVTLTGVAMHHMMEAWEQGDLSTLRGMFAQDMCKLAAAGADFFICPDNTAHIALEAPGDDFPLPALHIGEVVAEQALRDGRRKEDRQTVHDIIFDELCLGIFRDRSRAAYVSIIEKLAADGCDAVALVCTEIPLLITAEVSPLPILDSTRLLAGAAVEVALGDRSLPEWRGGPIS